MIGEGSQSPLRTALKINLFWCGNASLTSITDISDITNLQILVVLLRRNMRSVFDKYMWFFLEEM